MKIYNDSDISLVGIMHMKGCQFMGINCTCIECNKPCGRNTHVKL